MGGWKCLRKFPTCKCRVCSLPILIFFCDPLRSGSSSQRSYRKDYFLGMPSSSSYSFFWPQQSCAGLPKERMWPSDNRVIQQFVLVWSYFPWFPLGFSSASLPPMGRFAMPGMWSFGHHSLWYNSQFNNTHQKHGFSQELCFSLVQWAVLWQNFPNMFFEAL